MSIQQTNFVILAEAGTQRTRTSRSASWVPAFAGMTIGGAK